MPKNRKGQLTWRSHRDDDWNTVWEAELPYHYEGKPVLWRLCQRYFSNKIQWYTNHDRGLRKHRRNYITDVWCTALAAKIAVEKEHAKILRDLKKSEGKG